MVPIIVPHVNRNRNNEQAIIEHKPLTPEEHRGQGIMVLKFTVCIIMFCAVIGLLFVFADYLDKKYGRN